MSIIAGGTRALMQLLAQRKLEERQQMMDALTITDKQRRWEQDRLQSEQGTRQLDLQEKNQQLLREQDKRQQEEIEKQNRRRVLGNIAQRMQPSENVDPKLAQELEAEGWAPGLIERKPGLSMPMPDRPAPAEAAPGDIAPLPMSLGRAPVKVTPDSIKSLGGTDYQMGRKAAEERAEQLKLVQAQSERSREDTQAHQKELQAERDATRAMIAGIAAAGRQNMSGSQKVAATNALRRGFTADTKDFGTVASNYRTLESTLSQASPAGDLAAIFSFMKGLDPGSTVREGEQATARNAAGVPDQIRNYYNRIVQGTSLTPEQRKDFLGTAKGFYNSAKVQYDQRVKEYTDDALSLDIDPARVIRDLTVGSEPKPDGIVGPQQQPTITGIRLK